ncbi:MAG TPA: response regulator transcription factor, partial [Anaerolineales bacterium]|nr:response regulator transcription factor [Anaerolineales bacterium]
MAGKAMKEVSVLIVDDHPLFREGVRNVLISEEDIKIIGETTSGDEALQLVRDKQPMVALVDVNLPSMNGIQVTRQVVAERIKTAIVLLTAYDDVEQVLHAFKAGAAAYCSKDVEPGKLVDVIRNVARGYFVVGDQVYDQAGLDQWL